MRNWYKCNHKDHNTGIRNGYKGYIVMSQGWGGSFVGRTVVLRRRIGALISFFY